MKRLVWLLLMLTLAACGPAGVVTPTVTPSPSFTAVPPTATSTVTLMPTNIPTLIPTLNWTPLPTLSVQEKHAKIQELLETNNGCKLPCWWGIIPGKTTWSEASHFLVPLIIDIKEIEGHTSKSVKYEIDEESEPESLEIDVRDNIVIWVTTYQPESYYTYQLHQILGSLGIPEKIYISAESKVGKFGAELPPAIIFLDYTSTGVWATYGYLPTRVGENISICPQDFEKTTSIYELYRSVGGRLHLFDPKMEYPGVGTIDIAMGRVWASETVKKLEDATNMTIESFYNTFINPKPSVCLETPANLWP